MAIKLAFGVRNGHVIHISEIDKSEKGELCNCICPVCSGALIAKLGDKRQHHFAHKANLACDILHAQQTGLHLFAKEIIQKNRRILVPKLDISRSEIAVNCEDLSAAASVEIEVPYIGAKLIDYSSAETEKSIGEIIADAVITTENGPCIIEIAVTHFVDESKLKKLEKIGIPAFEINLSNLIELPETREAVSLAVLSDQTNRNWLFNPKKECLLKEKRSEFQNKLSIIREKRKQEEIRKKEYKKKCQDELQVKLEPVNYAKELKMLRNDRRATQWLKRFSFSKGLAEYPFYMDIPITGEFVFSCDRRIWQGKLFEDYVYQGFGNDLCVFYISQIHDQISKGKIIIRYDKRLVYRTQVILNSEKREISLSYDVIKRYFYYLELLGFVSHIGSEWYSQRPKSLEPPNQSIANILKTTLKSVDKLSPNIDYLIDKMLKSTLPESDINDIGNLSI